MPFVQTVMLSFRALRRNPLRTVLTTLGVLIGVAAVVAVIAIGEAASRGVQNSIREMGSNVLMIFPGGMFRGGVHTGGAVTLTDEDGWAIARELQGIAGVSPVVSTGAQLVAGGLNWSTSVMGTGHQYPQVKNWTLTSGAFFTEAQMKGAAKVCIIGNTVATQLYPGQDPVGQVLRVKKLPFRVIGVLSVKGSSSWGTDQDDVVIAPYTTVQKKLQRGATVGQVRQLMVSCETEEGMPEAVRLITDLLRQRHRLAAGVDDDFAVRSQADIAQTAAATAKTFQGLLAGIASISLLVGGIGIMNIMLVSVRERTREIGIRMAVGAKRRDILKQFLVEAVAISGVGGMLGLFAAGFVLLPVASAALGGAFGSEAARISPWSVVLALAFSSVVGVFFGWYPARTASRLDPIDCLRYE